MVSRKAKRIRELSEALAERRVLHLRDAALLLNVSEMTVRRDVAENPGQFGYLGGHIVPAADIDGDVPYELARAADSHAAAKREACIHAASHIRPDETIFIDCGTTLVNLIDYIPTEYPITAVCYALNVAEKLTRRANINLVLLGGLYYPSSASFSGAIGLETLNSLGINKAFISAAGVDVSRGATCAHFHEAPVKQKAISLAQKSYLVVDSSKIGKLKPAFFAPLDAFQAIITEEGEVDLSRFG
ncbi:DeoR family transcriptional regulator [Paramesorhizobium deserti]|uniref:DeoR family transcriptional regulator n=1 Tax=Paramesorhizobium deserti TaxID=1494590 RepID=A0A135HRH7_9HYPH|nr:DeoR/GlpR family DNA-binding transcription regulator [Paramesorhizobium deserti]KXF75753.1 DeoR family transcriptional regulator [Paramesorhizobium deserti]